MAITNQTFTGPKTVFSSCDAIECTFTGEDHVVSFENGYKAIRCKFIGVTNVSGPLIDCDLDPSLGIPQTFTTSKTFFNRDVINCTFQGKCSVINFVEGSKAIHCKFEDVTFISGPLIDCDLNPALGIPQTFTTSKTFSTCDAVNCTFTGEDSAITFQRGYRAVRCKFGDIAAISGPLIDCNIEKFSLKNYTANVCMTLKPGIMMCDGKVIKEGESFGNGNNISIKKTVIPRSSPKEPTKDEKTREPTKDKKTRKYKKEKRTKRQYRHSSDDDDEMTMFFDEETNSVTYAGKGAISLNGYRGIIDGKIVDLRK